MKFRETFEPGFTRRRRGRGWQYLTWNGKPVRSPAIIARLEAVALPPAYAQACYARHADAYLQATGVDAAGRRQYRYHPAFRQSREEAKFAACPRFGLALPAIRAAVERDLALPGVPRERIVAAVVRLLDVAQLRIGNRSYAKANRSHGATTLRNRHARVKGSRIWLDYVGKAGVRHRIHVEDARLARLVRRCQDEPGQTLFQYHDAAGGRHPVTSDDVNAWLKRHGGECFSAKDFRTWGGSVIAYGVLARSGGQVTLKTMLGEVAQRLGNTPAVARRSYVHPALIEAALAREPQAWPLPRATRWLSPEERGLLAFLEAQGRAETDVRDERGDPPDQPRN